MSERIDPRTGRPFGDHGTASSVVEFVLDDPEDCFDADGYNKMEFLRAWSEGGAFEEWPEFYTWLKEKGR